MLILLPCVMSARFQLLHLLSILIFASAMTSEAVLFYETADPNHNVGAPGGSLADSGWQWQGYFGSFLGTMISPTHFITAKHVPTNGSFVHDALFSGEATTTYSVNTAANGGLGYWDIGATDLRIYEITGGTFSSYAELFTGSAEVGSDLVVFGRGGVRGAAIVVDNGAGPQVQGYGHTASDGTARWGLNTVADVVSYGGGDLLAADFTAVLGQNEAHLSGGDSGGAVFIQDGGRWKLAGINFVVDGAYDTNDVPGDGSEFSAAMFDQGGLYLQNDPGWLFIPDQPLDQPGHFYSSRISSAAGSIQGVIGVPEPSSLTLLFAMVMLVRRRRLTPLATIRG